jgi:Arc/MetJ-type ribon-helix-helix transcriptional regulator
MSFEISPVVAQMIRQQMASGRYSSHDEPLIDALESLNAEQQELRAIQEGLDSLDRGEQGVSLDEAFEKLRNRHSI